MAVEEDKVQAKGYDLIAGQVYLLMKKEYHVSRNVRLQWFLEHINSTVTVDDPIQKHGEELIVLSVVPLDPPSEWNYESSHLYHYLVTSSTEIICLSETYSAVFCLDMSPSISTVDIQRGRVMIDEILISLRRSVEGFINSFRIPGSTRFFEPIVFVTVIVHTPFFTTPAQQVLVQGWKLTKVNVVEFLSAIEKQLQLLEDNIAHVSGLVHDQLAEFRMRQADSEKLVGALFEENTEKLVLPSKTEISMVSPDSGFINLLRYGMLALRLLPPSSCPNLIVITDGMITLPDIHVLDSVLSQLRNNAVAVSFLHVGSQFHPHCALGLVPYVELMQFIALATTGSYIPSPPAVVFPDAQGKTNLNLYQLSFLTWSFMKGGLGIEPCSGELSKGEWCVRNRRFDGNREPQLLTKKQSEDSLNVTLASVLCCRMREGYFVKSVYSKDDTVDLCLVLPWSNHIYIEYYVSSDWPSSESVRYAISIKAPYEFLHDITCLIKKPFHSPYRQAVVARFWSTLKTLNHADLLLSHLDSFQNNPATYTLPDSVRSGMPLFYLPSDSSQPVLSSNDSSCPQFAHFWRLISALDPGVWQKWLHTHRLGVVLTHDRPLPQFLHTPNPNGRFQSVQCRYAASTLFNFLKDWTSFVLIENHSFIKFITPSEGYDKVQTWFFIIRVTSKPPCVVLHVAFLGNTPGYLRNLAIETLKEKLSELKFPIRPTKKEQRQTSRKLPEFVGDQQQQMTECCMLLKKPLEKMLIRYERMPSEFGTVVFPDGTQPLIAAKPLRPASSLVTTLSRYLYHRRWVWSASARPGTSYSFGRAPLARLLANLTRMRLEEGFRFAHSTAGIINMVLEVNMKCFDEGTRKTDILPCVIQYVLFPPHTVFATPKNGNSDDEGAEDDQNELIVELISECWIEPQHGVVTRSPPNRFYMENLRYYQLADVMWWNDAACISSLLTFEHLRLMCQDSSVVIPEPITLKTIPNPLEKWPNAVALADERIQKVPFAYNLMNILPKCQQAQILFSLFIQELCGNVETKTSADMPNCLLMETFYENLKDLHDRDMCLSKEDSKKLIDLIIQREKDNVSLAVAEEVKEFSDGSNSKTGSNETLEVPMIGDWKRMISWATGEGDTEIETESGTGVRGLTGGHGAKRPHLHAWQRRNKATGAASAPPVQWRCFVKALSSSRCILTLVPASFQDVKALADEEFPASRLRANSWDMVGQRQSAASIRARTSSVGARVTGGAGTTSTATTTSTNPHSPSHAAITLPLFVYDCLVSNLIDNNCLSPTVKTGNDIFIDKTKETADDPSSEKDSDNSDITLEELSLREHCKMVMQSFNNAFVVSLFKSLRLGNSIHAVDVKTAVEECEESSVEIDITNYLKTVCGHLKELLAENQDENNATDNDVLLSVFKHPGPCLDYKHLHKLIKNKFLRIMTASFKAVPSNPKYYFCSPLWERDRQVVSTPFGHDDSCRVLESSNEFDSLHFSADMSDFRLDQSSMHGQSVWEGVGSVTTPDDARTSLIANMDSDSISNFPDDESIEDVPPLFLHLDCSLNSAGESNNCTVKIIPTCLNELLDVDDNKFEKLDLGEMTVVLRLVLTAKSSSVTATQPPPPPPTTDTTAATDSADNFEESAIAELLHHLPENQQKAVTQCVKEIEWLMHDEIAAFLLDAVPVTQQTLKFVSHHVVSSINRPSCLYEQVPLKFVFGLEHSMNCFLKDLAQMTIPCYCLQKEGDYYFLRKDENALKTQKSNEESFCNFGQTGDFWISSGGSQTNDDKKSIDSPSWTRTSDMRSCSQEFNKSSISGWSSVAAWHHNVSSLMENGLAAEDIYNVEHIDETSDWLTDLEKRRAILPNFWLIMKVDKESVSTYFHCRFLELETQKVKLYSLIQRSIVKNISQVCKIVNQTMLLQNLHNTRLCNPLLEPETTEDDSWTSSPKIKLQVGGNETESGFPEGMFACNVVWKTHFALHPRLKTGPGKPRLSRGIQALQTVLNRFSVNNRKNMFVYQDKNENVFYLRLYEKTQIRTIDVEDISPGSVSRSSSINSLNREYNKRLLDEQLSVNKEPPRPRLKSFGESGDGTFTSKQEDFITLQVHGIYEAGSEVKLELVQVLQNRLNDAVLEVVSVMLARNPMCKLSPEDVHFIQKQNSTPDNFIKFTIPSHASSHLQALAYYLRQNLLQFLYMPKYTDSRTHNHFQDYSYPNDYTRKIPEENMLLYNQSPSSGNKGIACIGFALVSVDGCLVAPRDECPLPSSDAYNKHPLSQSEFHTLTETTTISDEQISASGESTFIEFRVWKQGRVNIESLTHMLKASIRHTLWDLLMEYNLLTAPLTKPSADHETSVGSELAPAHQAITVPWLKLAVTLGVPAVKPLFINLTARHPVDVTLKEVFNLISVSDTTGFVFYKSNDEENDRLVYLQQVNSDFDIPVSSCIIIGRNMSYWKACHTNDPESLAVRNDKAHSISSHFPPFCDSSSDPMIFIPRQRFLLAVITSKNITIYTYNWAKERIELLKKHVSNLGQWLSARCSLLTGILAQKMGLFHNKPFARKTTGQSGLSHATDVESLVSFSLQTVKQQRSSGSGIAQLSEVLRDTKPTSCKKSNSSDHVILNVQRILDSRNDEKRDHQKKLYMMWQARGATPNIPLAEDILHIFIQHSRNIHYCLTPLLFLPRWRIESAATRDHSLKVVQASPSDTSASKSDDKWHQQLCNNFVHEYKQYLQSLGFIPIQIAPSTPKKGVRRNSISQSTKNSCFLQKSLLGGILLFELFLSEPFFHTKLHALECSRLQISTPLLSQFIMSFLDECDRVKILMHLHSFTYDYHLRCLHWFISNKQLLLRPGYHITSFIDDFIKYYTKAPNYARSLVFSDSMLIRDISTPAMQLFNYLLNNEKDYKMEVYCMLPFSENSQENEFVLVQLSQTPQIIYKDAHDMKQSDDFDVTLMVAQEENRDPNALALHFYLLLTSRRELYPNLEIERKLGKFCPVSTVSSLTDTDGGEKKREILALPVASNESTQHNEIRPESVNYLGYYSSHEQLMQQLILEQAEAARRHIIWMASQGSLDCRTHLLWNKLMSNYPLNNTLTHGELVELCNLAQVDLLSAIDPRLSSLLAQSLTWYQSLVKVLVAKYSDLCRTFTSPDNNVQHFLILHPKLMKGFVMLTLDMQAGRGEISVVCRKSHRHDQHDVSTSDLHSLIEGVVNATGFHLWTGLL